MVGPIDVKRKGSALVGYWVQYVTLTFDLTHDIDLGCFKVKFRNNSISGIVGLIYVKWKGSELIWYLADCMTLPFDHTHDLDLVVSRSDSEIALSREWGGQLTMIKKDVSHPFMTMILTCVTMVGWADVPDSDWGDFRRRRAVDIPNYLMFPAQCLRNYISTSAFANVSYLMADVEEKFFVQKCTELQPKYCDWLMLMMMNIVSQMLPALSPLFFNALNLCFVKHVWLDYQWFEYPTTSWIIDIYHICLNMLNTSCISC